MSDNLDQIWQSFFAQRTKPLLIRFPGTWKAVVTETNDPLRMRRIRFKIPELHDWDLKPEETPWATPAYDLGTKRCGRFSYPCIGDYVWITFEKNHPYSPIYTGFADPTRRKFYPLPSLYGRTPIPVDETTEIDDLPNDYETDYLPKDERPMSHGWQDRYGSLDIHNAVGFFPIEHTVQLPPPDADPLTKSTFTQSTNNPEVNNPDSKMMCRISKYGMVILQADMGYKWKKKGGVLDTEQGGIEEDRAETGGSSNGGGSEGEFTGDFDEDEQFEIDRWLYFQRLLHEDPAPSVRYIPNAAYPEPGDPSRFTGHDMRRILLLSRYGNKFEMRDVGWNKSRENEWWPKRRDIGSGDDERWMKMRTKGGHIFQIIDIGFDPENDEFVDRLLIDEVKKVYLDKEDKYTKEKEAWNQYGERDMRMVRAITRSGIKFVLDDRTSHDGGKYRPPYSASANSRLNEEIGIGALIKGRATPGTKEDDYGKLSGSPTGYFWQFDERPNRNSTSWGTPMGQIVEMDDNEEFLAICSRVPELPTKWKYLEDNEFLEESLDSLQPWKKTHHLLIDHGRELIRLKTRAGAGEATKNKKFNSIGASGEFAGLEIHDAPTDDPWAELVDIDKRGVWFSRKDSIGIWRAKDGTDIEVWLDDNKNNIVLRNATSGKVQIYCSGNVELISDKLVSMQAPRIDMNAQEIRMAAGGVNFTFQPSGLRTDGDIYASNVRAFFPTAERPADVAGRGIGQAAGGGSPPENINKEGKPSRIQPDNRLHDVT